VVPGYVVTTVADVPIPAYIAFAPDGTLYVGNTNDGFFPISRVTPAGVSEFCGPPISDADVVLVDASGEFTGVAGAVVVGGLDGGTGRIAYVVPCQDSDNVLYHETVIRNPGELRLDSLGRLIYPGQGDPPDQQSSAIMRISEGTPQLLVDGVASASLEIDALDRVLVVDLSSGELRRFDADGLSDPLSTPVFLNPDTSSIQRGAGPRFTAYLYAIDAGNLLAIDENGNQQRLGTGFPENQDFAFHPITGLLYFPEPHHLPNPRIRRLDPDCNGNGVPDQDDIANCPIGDSSCGDCDSDAVPDGCLPCDQDCECDDRDICTWDQCHMGDCTHSANAFGDVNHDGIVDIFDILHVLDGFAGVFNPPATKSNVDLAPCAGDDLIDIFDILAVLDAFTGLNLCDCPAGP
jgi:hypothetical protein